MNGKSEDTATEGAGATGKGAQGRSMKRHLSLFAAWGLSFGYAVGWGAFVMPGAEFLPGAGPLGTAIGISVGALAIAGTETTAK